MPRWASRWIDRQNLTRRRAGVVLRYRMHLESRHLAPGTVNLRLGAVRPLAYEAADCGLLNPDLAAGIRRVKGVKKLGVRVGNWLTPEQSQRLLQAPEVERLRGKRDRALLALLLACGLRRREAERQVLNLDVCERETCGHQHRYTRKSSIRTPSNELTQARIR